MNPPVNIQNLLEGARLTVQPTRHLSESLAVFLPFAIILRLILFFNVDPLFQWTEATVVISSKSGRLNS